MHHKLKENLWGCMGGRIASLKKYHPRPTPVWLWNHFFFLFLYYWRKTLKERKNEGKEEKKGVYKNRKSQRKREYTYKLKCVNWRGIGNGILLMWGLNEEKFSHKFWSHCSMSSARRRSVFTFTEILVLERIACWRAASVWRQSASRRHHQQFAPLWRRKAPFHVFLLPLTRSMLCSSYYGDEGGY